MADPVQLAELVCTRFSHDLSGLLGSLSGVIELIAEAHKDGEPTEEVALAMEVAAELTQRLRLLRAAWGGPAPEMDLETLRELARGAANKRLTLDLDGVAADTIFPSAMARMVLNVVLLAAEALPRGGVLALSGDPLIQVVAQIAGPDAAWPAGLASCLVDEAQAWAALGNPRALQVPLTALIARASGMRLSILMAAGPAQPGSAPPLLLAKLPH